MGIFEKLKKESLGPATAIPATPAIFNPNSGQAVAEIAKIAVATPTSEKSETPTATESQGMEVPSEEQMVKELEEFLDPDLVRGRSLLETGDPWDPMLERLPVEFMGITLPDSPDYIEGVDTLSDEIRSLLSGGPVPYSDIERQLSLRGVTEDELRAAIRNMPELIAYDGGGTWTWEIRRPEIDPVTLSERIGLRFEQEIPDTLAVRGDHPEDTEKALGKPCITYRDHVLAWEKDPPITKVYAWALVHLHPGKPLPVEVEDMAGSLSLTPREVRDALFRLAKDGDLERTTQRGGRDLYRLIVRYPERESNDGVP